MVKEYLSNQRQELLEKKIDLQKQLHKNELSTKENEEFLRYIQSTENKSYDSFTPSNYKNDRNEQKKKLLKEEIKELHEQEIFLTDELVHISEKIEELDEVIEFVKSEEKNNSMAEQSDTDTLDISDKADIIAETDKKDKLDVMVIDKKEFQKIVQKIQESEELKFDRVLHKIYWCNNLAGIDGNRCKIELKALYDLVLNKSQEVSDKICELVNSIENVSRETSKTSESNTSDIFEI